MVKTSETRRTNMPHSRPKTYIPKLDQSLVDRYLQLDVSDLDRDLLIDGRTALYEISLSLNKGLASAPANVWRQAAAVSELQSQNAAAIGDRVAAVTLHNEALDYELHAFRLETNNNGQVIKHVMNLRKRLPGI
jgi:hypothetical protein